MRAHRRQVALPARDRHALRARAVRRDRRVGAIRSSRPARRVCRDRPERPHHRSAAPARGDHQRWLYPRAAADHRGGAPLPPRPVVGAALERRQRGQAPEIIHIAWRATPPQRPLASSKTPDANPTASSRSRSPANSPATAGRSPPGPPAHPDRVPPTSLPARDPLTQPASNPASKKKTATTRTRLTNSR